MRGSLIRHVDPWQDASRGARYKGDLTADRMPRIAEIAALQKPLHVILTVHRGAKAEHRGAVEIELEVSGELETTCQRCLSSLSIEVAVHNKVWVVSDEETAQALTSSGDTVLSPPGERLDLAAMAEDEVLLALPFAPSHAIGACEAQLDAQPDGLWDNEYGADGRSAHTLDGDEIPGDEVRAHTDGSRSKPNPFAVLAGLRKQTKEHD